MTETLFPAAACVQFAIALGEPDRNLDRVVSLVEAYRPAPGTLLVLPEMWATGFAYDRVEELGRRTPEMLAGLQALAARHDCRLAGTLIEPADQGLPTNTLFLVGPQGVIGRQAKRRLFSFWQEERHFTPGSDPGPLATPFGPLATLICYELRFPELARQQVFAGSRLLAVSAEWPLARLDHWLTLLRARAIENQVYVVAANGCGRTGSMTMAGHSLIIGPDGTVLADAGGEEGVVGVTLDPALVDEQRGRFFPAGERGWPGDDRTKVRDLDDLLAELTAIRRHGSRIAFTNGCFDILHAGHVNYLQAARRTADCLVVGLNSDSSVRALKGPGRPVNSEADRARVLAALGAVDYVVLFAEENPLRLITAIRPEVLVKGADWPEAEIVGAAEVRAAGGRVERIALTEDRSTTGLLTRIRRTSD